VAKRFIDSELFRKEWFRKLSPKLKCAWIFMILESEESGEFHVDLESLNFHVGQKIDLNELIESITKSDPKRILTLEENKLWISKLISFQYKNLSFACSAHKPIIFKLKKLLTEYPSLSLNEALPKGYQSLKEMEEEEEKEKEKVKVKEMGRGKRIGTGEDKEKKAARKAFENLGVQS